MNIIFGDNIAELARKKYTVLELDTFLIESQTCQIVVSSQCSCVLVPVLC
jgi:hypothetical protein